MGAPEDPLDDLVAAVMTSPKYRQVSPALVRSVGARELSIRRNLKDAIKATKNKLHQVGALYFDGQVDYERARRDIEHAAGSGDPENLRQVCRYWMGFHASTRERLGILEDFFATTLASIQPVRSVVDLACGLNPLAIPWLPLAAGCRYYACDIFADLVAFLRAYFSLAGVDGTAEVQDILQPLPIRPAQVALLLKAIPCLEQVDKDAGLRLMETVQADHLLISFPARSLGGRSRGMPVNYSAHFEALVRGRPWKVQKFEFATELAFLVSK